MATSQKHLNELMIGGVQESEGSRRSETYNRTSNLEAVEAKQKPLPIITAKVTSQISID